MRAYLEIPDRLIPVLQDQASAAYRTPRRHLEWLILQILQEHPPDEQPCQLRPTATPEEVTCAAE